MRRRKERLRFPRLPVAPCGGLVLYAVLTLLVFIFAQVLRTDLPAALLTFMLAFGAADVVLLLLTLPAIRLTAKAEGLTVERGGRAHVKVTVRNMGIIPVSAFAVALGYPTADPSRLGYEYKRISVSPLSARTVTVDAATDRRGTFAVGVTDVYVYDMLGAFRVRLGTRGYGAKSITVMPKCMQFIGSYSDRDGAEDTSDRQLELSAVGDYGDVREYRPGDSMKQIHWKLSTKGDELQVRKYASETEKHASVFLWSNVNKELVPSVEEYCEVIDRLFDEAYTVAMEAAEMGCEGNVTVNGGVGIRFGSKFDNERLASSLAAMGYDLPIGTDLPADDVGSNIYVVAFTDKGDGAVFTDRLRSVVSGRSSVCVVSLENFISEDRREEYRSQLGFFLQGLSALGIKASLSARGGEDRV